MAMPNEIYATDQKVSVSPFDQLADAVSQIMAASGEVSRIADRISGPVPTDDGAASTLKEVSAGGLIDSMEESTRDINMAVDRILASVKRIETRL